MIYPRKSVDAYEFSCSLESKYQIDNFVEHAVVACVLSSLILN